MPEDAGAWIMSPLALISFSDEMACVVLPEAQIEWLPSAEVWSILVAE
jgi:hypothetical protein